MKICFAISIWHAFLLGLAVNTDYVRVWGEEWARFMQVWSIGGGLAFLTITVLMFFCLATEQKLA